MTARQRPLDADALAQNFTVFAAADCVNEPLYAALSRAARPRGAPHDQLRP